MSIKVQMLSWHVCDCCGAKLEDNDKRLKMPPNPNSDVDMGIEYCLLCVQAAIGMYKKSLQVDKVNAEAEAAARAGLEVLE